MPLIVRLIIVILAAILGWWAMISLLAVAHMLSSDVKTVIKVVLTVAFWIWAVGFVVHGRYYGWWGPGGTPPA